MPKLTRKADAAALVDAYDAVLAAVTLPDGAPAPDTSGLQGSLAKKATLASLQACVKSLESAFSNNCNCLVNTDCCQTCQTAACQSTYCQSAYCQSCQSQTCQSCQKNCSSSDCDCSSH